MNKLLFIWIWQLGVGVANPLQTADLHGQDNVLPMQKKASAIIRAEASIVDRME
jgi:hypothetical protein